MVACDITKPSGVHIRSISPEMQTSYCGHCRHTCGIVPVTCVDVCKSMGTTIASSLLRVSGLLPSPLSVRPEGGHRLSPRGA